MLSFVSDKVKLFVEIFSKISNLYDSGISLPTFPSRTKMKLHNISLTLTLVAKVITKLDYSGVSGFLCILEVVLKNCKPELSYLLAEFFTLFLKESFFLDFWKVSTVVAVFKSTLISDLKIF